MFVYSSYHLNLQIVLNTPKNSLPKSSHPRKMLAKCFYPKKSQRLKCQTQIFLRSSLSLEIWSTTPLPFDFSNSKDTRKTCFYFHLIVERNNLWIMKKKKCEPIQWCTHVKCVMGLCTLNYQPRTVLTGTDERQWCWLNIYKICFTIKNLAKIKLQIIHWGENLISN